jgi:O-antigen/teichoic acid export membrane protein
MRFASAFALLDPLRSRIGGYFGTTLYRNSLFIGFSRVISASIGLIFWQVAARYYPAEMVGTAIALITSLGIVVTFSRLGFDFSIIRFMPLRDRNAVFSTCLTMTALSSLIFSAFFLLTIQFISPSISFIRDYALIFILLAGLSSILLTTGNTYLSLKRGEYYLAQNALDAVRIPALIPLSILGAMGIFLSSGLSIVLCSLAAVFFILKAIKLKFAFSRDFLRETSRLSTINYISDLLLEVPSLLLPLLILNLLGATDVAQYYIAVAIGNIILLVPLAVSVSFFIEGSHGTNLKREFFRGLKFIYALLLPAVIFIYFFGGLVLQSFGSVYAQSLDLLRIYALSSFFIVIHLMFVPILNVKLMVGRNIELSLLRFVVLLGLSYFFIIKFGLIGVGYAWMISHGILCLGIIALSKANGWI